MFSELLSHVSSISQTYVNNLPAEIIDILETEESWGFDIISLERLTNKRPLVTLGLKTMTRFNVLEYLKIDQILSFLSGTNRAVKKKNYCALDINYKDFSKIYQGSHLKYLAILNGLARNLCCSKPS